MSLIDDIKAQIAIVEVATRYTHQMWPRGRTQVCRCLCGHNTDRHPSFTLYPAQARFYCYACNCGGDVINLVELADPAIAGLAERHRRREAIRALANWYGIHTRSSINAEIASRPETMWRSEATPRTEPEPVIQDDVLAILEAATTYYEDVLMRQEEVIRYLTQKRGLTDSTIRQLRIGYSDGRVAWALNAGGMNLGSAARMGLLTPSGEKLRGRIIVPVVDAAGAPVWLMGRAFAADTEPKYDSLADGLIHKQPMQFGQAKRGIVLVEGAFDAAALVQWQVHTEWLVVAMLGTGHRQVVEQLSRSHPGARVVLLLDQDKAGKAAALKAAIELQAHGLQPSVILDADRQTKLKAKMADGFSRAAMPDRVHENILQELGLVEAIESRQWSQWVNWGGAVKDPGDLLGLGDRGRMLLIQALATL